MSLRVLLTGGAGFLGSHAAEALLHEGARVFLVDRLDAPAPWKRENLAAIGAAGEVETFSAELEDFAALERAFVAARPDVVVHLAARASVGDSVRRPLEAARTNVTGTLHVLELCRRLGTARLVFASSSVVYGPASPVPFREDALDPAPTSPYAASKLAGEHYCRTWARVFGLRVVVLRISTVYGPRQRLGGAVPNFVAAIESGQPLRITGDGSAIRDFFHVSDFAAGLAAALALRPEAPFEVFNLGSGRGISLNDLAAAVERAAGRTAPREYVAASHADAGGGWVEIARARERLGWQPRISLEEGLAGYVEWRRGAGGARNNA